MKMRLAVLVALVSPAWVIETYAQPTPSVLAPSTQEPSTAPSLYPSEQGAFKVLEVATQIVEAGIVQNGCVIASYPFEAHTTSTGTGAATLGAAPSQVQLAIVLAGSSKRNGRRYKITGSGSLDGLSVTNITGQGSFNIGSTLQALKTGWHVQNTETGGQDKFKGTIIKDYWRLSQQQPIPNDPFFENRTVPVSTVIGYGYQQLTKKNYTVAKYWQQSQTWRENGVNPGTYWLKTQISPEGETCAIEVKLQGYGIAPADNISGFNESGVIRVLGVDPGPFAK